MEKGVTLVVHHHEIAPFSWMKYIVISQKDLEENGREILIHEMAHIHHRHSIDLLLADICIFLPMVQSRCMVVETGVAEYS